jgi:hypothetical protein
LRTSYLFIENRLELCLSIKRGKRVDYVQAKPGLTRLGEQEKDMLSSNTKPPLAECSPLVNAVFDPCCYLHHWFRGAVEYAPFSLIPEVPKGVYDHTVEASPLC